MTTEGATNLGRGGNSDDPEIEEIPECESDLESLSVGCFDTFCEIFLPSAGACLSKTGFPKGFSRFGSNFPGIERDFDLSECCRDFVDGRGCGPPKVKKVPTGAKV